MTQTSNIEPLTNALQALPIATVSAVAAGVAIAITAVKLAKSLRRVVKPNAVHIVQKRNSTVNYGKGFEAGNAYWEFPEWLPVIGLTKIVLPLSIFDLDLKNYEAYDEDKVPFMVDVKAFFVINQPSVAATRVSDMRELMEQLTGILQGTVRMVLAKHTIEKIMVERSTFGDLFTSATEEQLKEWGVRNAKPIELMDIRDGRDSETITRIMAKKESKIEMESRSEVADNIKNAEIAEIDAQREADVQRQQALQLVGERTAQKDQAIGVADEQAKQVVQAQAKTTAERDMAVIQVKVVKQAEIQKEARLVQADEQRQTKIIDADAVKQENIVHAEGEKQQAIIKAEGTKAQTVTVAEGDLVDQQLEAKGTLAVGEAVAEAARLLEMARVSPELALAAEIGENVGYQEYLTNIRGVEKDENVGVANAKALEDAGIKIIANAGNVPSGMDSVMDLFSGKGGLAAGTALETFAQTDAGKALLQKFGVHAPANVATKTANGHG